MKSSDLKNAYTTSYYLEDCGGYETFLMSGGKRLDWRLESIARLSRCHPEPSRVLDLGCGRGELARYFAARGCQVVAIDYSLDAISLAKQCLSGEPHLQQRVNLICGSVLDLSFYQGLYDLVIASDLIEHLAPGELDELYRLVRAHLAPEGLFLLHSYPNQWFYRYGYPRRRRAACTAGEQLPEEPRTSYELQMHINEQAPNRMRRQLRRQFEEVLLWVGDHPLPVGSLNPDFRLHDWSQTPSIFALAGRRPIDPQTVIDTVQLDFSEPVSELPSLPCMAPEQPRLLGLLHQAGRFFQPLKHVPVVGHRLQRGYRYLLSLQNRLNRRNHESPESTDHRWQVAFQERFRGSSIEITERLRPYLRDIAGAPLDTAHPLLDLGCGRGDWLCLLREHGYPAIGIDSDQTTIDTAQARGLQVQQSDVLTFLSRSGSGSYGAVTAFHLVEHLEFDDLRQLLSAALNSLVPGGMLIVETPNPENLRVAACHFYLDPTHKRPLLPALLEFALEFVGFSQIQTLYLSPDDPAHQLPGEGELVEGLNRLLYGPRDYAIIARKPVK